MKTKFRFWHLADIDAHGEYVCLWEESGHPWSNF